MDALEGVGGTPGAGDEFWAMEVAGTEIRAKTKPRKAKRSTKNLNEQFNERTPSLTGGLNRKAIKGVMGAAKEKGATLPESAASND